MVVSFPTVKGIRPEDHRSTTNGVHATTFLLFYIIGLQKKALTKVA
jgi:hypothetical protein